MFPFPYGRWKHVSLHLTSSQTHLWFFLLPIILLKFEKGWLIHVRASRSGTHYSRAILFHHHVSSGPLRWLLFPTFYRIPFQNCCKYDTVSKSLHWMCYVSISYWFFLIECIKHTWQGGMGHKENLPNILPVLIRGYIEIYYYFCMKGAYETYYLPIPFTYHVI